MTLPLGRVSLTALLLSSALIQAVVFLVRPTTSYQALALGVEPVALGAIGSAFALVPLLLALPAGAVVDRVGARPMMLVGSVVTVIATVTLVLAGHHLVGLIGGTALLGAGHLACIVGQQSAVAASAKTARLDSMFGYYTFFASLGQAVGPLLLPLGEGDDGAPNTSVLFGVGSAIAVALIVATLLIRVPRAEVEHPRAGGSTLALLRIPGVLRAITTSAIIVAAVDLTVVYVPALGDERGWNATAVGFVLAVRAAFSMVSRLLLGWLARRWGRGRLMATSIALSAVSLVLLVVPMPLWGSLVVAAALGLGLGVGQPLTMSWVSERAPDGQRGRALAVRLAGNRLSQVAIPAAVGTGAAGLGATGVLAMMGALIAATLFLVRGTRLDDE